MGRKKNKSPQNANKAVAKNAAPVYNEILIRPIHRGVNDIGTWRTALRIADLGNRCRLYDLYKDLLIDGYLSDAIDKRIDAVTDADLSFTIDGAAVDAISDMMDTIEFELFLRDIMMSRFWGISLDECDFTDGFNFQSIPRKHIRTACKEVAIREEDERGIPYADNDFMLQFGQPDDFGVILRAAPFVIYKRGGFGDWAQFTELFGMPQRIGKYSSMDEQSRRALIRAFEEAGSAPYLVIPKETEATQTTLSSSGNGALYNDFRQACNEEILITILGQTMTTQDGASLSQSQVHMEVQEKKHRSDRRFVERCLNKYFVPLLEKRGYPVAGGRFKFLDKSQELTVADTVQLSDIMPIPQSYLHEKYNIPLPEGDEPIARRQAAPMFQPADPAPDPAKQKIENSDNRNFFMRMYDFFWQAPQAGAANGPARIRLNDDTLNNRLINQVSDGGAYFNAELFDYIAGDLMKALHSGWKETVQLADTGFTYRAHDAAFVTSMETNLFQFSAAKTLAEIQELNSLLRESANFEAFGKKAEETMNTFNKVWQKTEYQTAVLTAESASTYQRLIEQIKLFPYWEYKTAGDDKVRMEHAALDGLILPADDPLWDKIYPPNGWKCRCYVVARMAHEVADVDFDDMRTRCDAYFSTKDWQQAVAQHWDVNRGKTAEVFTRNQMYIAKFPTVAAKKLNKIPLATWGVEPSLSKRIAQSSTEAVMYPGKVQDYWLAHSSNGKITVADYKQREWCMNQAAAKRSDTACLPNLADVTGRPDEVWITQGDKTLSDYLMIRYYKDMAIAVRCRVTGTVLTIEELFQLKTNSLRTGLLIKK